MILGDPDSFAIEFELDADHCGEWLYGSIYYWLGGSRLGNGQCTCLRGVLFELEHMRWPRGDLKNRRLFDLPGKELAELLSFMLYQVPSERLSDLDLKSWGGIMEEEGWIRHQILPADPSFCGLLVYCVQSEVAERVIWTTPPYGEVSEKTLPVGEVHSVLEATIACLQELYDKERKLSQESG